MTFFISSVVGQAVCHLHGAGYVHSDICPEPGGLGNLVGLWDFELGFEFKGLKRPWACWFLRVLAFMILDW